METPQEGLLLDITEAFLSFQLFIGSPLVTLNNNVNQTYLSPLVDEEGVSVSVLRQSQTLLIDNGRHRSTMLRGLQDSAGPASSSSTLRPLYVTLQVKVVAREPSGMSLDLEALEGDDDGDEPIELPNLDDFDLDFILQQIFIENQVEYIEALQITGEDFFNGIDQVNVLLESTIGEIHHITPPPSGAVGDEEDGEEENGLDPPPLLPTDFQQGSSNGNEDENFFTTPLIIGIAVGGGVLLCSIICCLWYCIYFRRRQRSAAEGEKTADDAGASSGTKAAPTPKNKPWNRRRNKNDPLDGPIDSMAERHLMSTETGSNRPDDEVSEVASDVDTGSMAMYSYNPRGDSGSVYTASNSLMIGGGGGNGAINSNYSMYGNDNMSYAYSLEPGIEASIADGVIINNSPMNQSNSAIYDESVRSRVPIREIPQISVDAVNGAASRMTETSSRSAANSNKRKDDGFGDTHIETSASDLKLTPSELAMLPSNLRSGDDDDEVDEADSKGFPTAQKSTTKTVLAPSGKLGIVIDTTVEGPVVHKVNPGSRLEGQVLPGDVIVAIDNVDTRAMSASAITALMVKTASQKRTLTVRRVDSATK